MVEDIVKLGAQASPADDEEEGHGGAGAAAQAGRQ